MQRDAGTLFNGVQRLGTIFEFVGILKDDKGNVRPPLALSGTELLPSLDKKTYKGSKSTAISPSLRRDFDRSKINVVIILKESDPTSKYELFMRLNTGGSKATEQEVRNCLMVWLNEDFFGSLEKLATYEAFLSSINITDRLRDEAYHMELVLRFLILRSMEDERLSGIGDVGDFLNRKTRELASDHGFAYKKEGDIFRRTFDVIAKIGEDAFRRYDAKRSTYSGPFLISVFEPVALGVAANLDAVERAPADWLVERVRSLWTNKDFTTSMGAGKTASSRIKRLIPLGRRWFNYERHDA